MILSVKNLACSLYSIVPFKDAENINLLVARNSDSERKHESYLDYLISSMRKRVRTTFREISNFFPEKIQTVTMFGFLLKVVIFIFG